MFYFNEIIYRFIYLLILFIAIFFITFNYKEEFLLIFILSTIKLNNYNNYIITEISFICNTPEQFLNVTIGCCLSISFFFLIPFLFFHINDFFSSIFNIKIKKLFLKEIILMTILFYLLNFLSLTIILPFLWLLIEFINQNVILSSSLNIEYEPNLIYFIFFILKYNLFFNFLILILLFIIKFSLNQNFYTYLKHIKLVNLFIYTIIFFVFYIFLNLDLNSLIAFNLLYLIFQILKKYIIILLFYKKTKYTFNTN